MKPETIQDYLQRAEMSEAQSVALSNILGEMATKSEILRLEDRMRAYENRLDDRFAAFEEKIEQRFAAFEEKMDSRFAAFEEKMDARFAAFEDRMDERIDRKLEALKAALNWKLVAFAGLIVTVDRALDILLG